MLSTAVGGLCPRACCLCKPRVALSERVKVETSGIPFRLSWPDAAAEGKKCSVLHSLTPEAVFFDPGSCLLYREAAMWRRRSCMQTRRCTCPGAQGAPTLAKRTLQIIPSLYLKPVVKLGHPWIDHGPCPGELDMRRLHCGLK